jgi:hypothetical protein
MIDCPVWPAVLPCFAARSTIPKRSVPRPLSSSVQSRAMASSALRFGHESVDTSDERIEQRDGTNRDVVHLAERRPHAKPPMAKMGVLKRQPRDKAGQKENRSAKRGLFRLPHRRPRPTSESNVHDNLPFAWEATVSHWENHLYRALFRTPDGQASKKLTAAVCSSTYDQAACTRSARCSRGMDSRSRIPR